MKRKARRVAHHTNRKFRVDSTELLIISFVSLVLLTFFAWMNGLLPAFISQSLPLVR